MATKQNPAAGGHPLWLRCLAQAVILYGIWLLLSGHYDPFHLAMGAVSVGLVLWLNRQGLVSRRTPPGSRLRIGRLLLYVPWLAWEILLSGIYVARIVLSPRLEIQPALLRFKSPQPNDVARVILGNSITLTPGTLTIEIVQDQFLVHALTETTASGVVDGRMQCRVARLFVDDPGETVFDVKTSRS